MTTLVIDSSLVFRFTDDWVAVDWEKELVRLERAGAGKNVDIVATDGRALLLEVKDDRLKTAWSRTERRQAVDSGAFLAEMAQKMRSTLEVLSVVARTQRRVPLYVKFLKRWQSGSRLLVLWWELPPKPPSGSGTEIDRWKKTLSAQTNVLKSQLSDVSRHIRIANQRIDPHVVEGMHVEDVPDGLRARREDVTKVQAGRTQGPRRKST